MTNSSSHPIFESAKQRHFIIETSDRKQYPVREYMAIQSVLLRDMIRATNLEENSIVILPKVDSYLWEIVSEWMGFHEREPMHKIVFNPITNERRLKSFTWLENHYFGRHLTDIWRILITADYLNIQRLYDAACQKLAQIFEWYSLDQLRHSFFQTQTATLDVLLLTRIPACFIPPQNLLDIFKFLTCKALNKAKMVDLSWKEIIDRYAATLPRQIFEKTILLENIRISAGYTGVPIDKAIQRFWNPSFTLNKVIIQSSANTIDTLFRLRELLPVKRPIYVKWLELDLNFASQSLIEAHPALVADYFRCSIIEIRSNDGRHSSHIVNNPDLYRLQADNLTVLLYAHDFYSTGGLINFIAKEDSPCENAMRFECYNFSFGRYPDLVVAMHRKFRYINRPQKFFKSVRFLGTIPDDLEMVWTKYLMELSSMRGRSWTASGHRVYKFELMRTDGWILRVEICRRPEEDTNRLRWEKGIHFNVYEEDKKPLIKGFRIRPSLRRPYKLTFFEREFREKKPLVETNWTDSEIDEQ